MSLKKVINCIKNNHNFLITSHTNPEGDALGAELAFFRLLKAMGKHATIINTDKAHPGYGFLPEINNIMRFQKNIKNVRFNCLVVLDCSDLRRCGGVTKLNTGLKTIVNIDHHISNLRFGNINWVESGASSCSEMIYKLYKALHIPLNRNIAMLLYVGILTDTGSFRYSNVNSLTHKIVSELLRFDLDVVEIYKNIYENIPFQDMKLLIKILPTLRRQFQGKIAWFQIKQNLIKNKKISFDLSEHILSFGRMIRDVEVVVLFKENLSRKDEIRVNFRSTGKIDVNKIAQFFGGGGHKTASGCTLKGNIDHVRRRVLSKVRDSFQ